MDEFTETELINEYRAAISKKTFLQKFASENNKDIMELVEFLYAHNEISNQQYSAYQRFHSADAEDRAAFEAKKAELMQAKGKTEPKKEQTITPLPSILPAIPETVLKLCRDFLEDHKAEYFAARELVGEYEQIQSFIERGEKNEKH